MVHEQRVARVGMRVPPRREQHDGAEMHRPAPELREAIVLHAEILDLLRVRVACRDGRHLLVHRDRDLAAGGGIEVHLRRLAVEVAGLPVPVLPLALVHRHLDRMAVRAMEGLVAVEQRLDPVVARGDVLQTAHRPSGDPVVDHDALARPEAVDVDAENRPRAVGAILVALRARLRFPIVGDEEEDAAVERLRASGRGKGNGEAKRARVTRPPGE